MRVDLAKTAGFCFGVRQAVDKVYALLREGKRVATLGPIIHNPQVVRELQERGVRILERPEEAAADEVVIRSHGVGRAVYEAIAATGAELCDATCPFVAKIHRIVGEQPADRMILIAGDPSHPEVCGIRGHCTAPSFVFSSPADLEEWIKNHEEYDDKQVILLAQTTFQIKFWEKCAEIAKKHYTNPLIFDTICNATANRQQEAERLAASHELMVIVGGRESSNTAKLRDICAERCPTYWVETAADLSKDWFRGVQSAGLTAGASTPADIIKEVQATMSEIVKNETQETEVIAAVNPTEEQAAPQKSFDEMSFEEALEASLQSLNTNERVHGIVVGIAPNEVQVEVIGRKQTGYVPADELSATPNVNPADVVKIGDELELLIMRTNDQEGTIMLSKKRVDALKGWDDVVKASESGEVMEGVVTDVIKGGVLAVTHGVRVFIPASHASIGRMEDLSPLKGQTVQLKIIETNPHRRHAVGSVRQVAQAARKEQEEAFWAQAEVGQIYTGTVKSLTSYGAFVDLGGVDGMVHISEMSWSRIKNPSEVMNVGDTVTVYIKGLDAEKKKISLGYRKAEDNPWEIFKAQFPVDSIVTAKVVGMTTFGVFAEILPGVDGLIHISQIANHRVEKPQDELKVGQEVTAKITAIDYDRKRISLSIRALLDPEEAPAAETAEEPATEE